MSGTGPSIVEVVASAAIVLGLLSMTVAVIGTLRSDDVYVRVHAASKAIPFGAIAVLVAAVGTGDGALIGRAALVAAFLLVTAPVSSHVIAWAAHEAERDSAERRGAEGQRVEGHGAERTRKGASSS